MLPEQASKPSATKSTQTEVDYSHWAIRRPSDQPNQGQFNGLDALTPESLADNENIPPDLRDTANQPHRQRHY